MGSLWFYFLPQNLDNPKFQKKCIMSEKNKKLLLIFLYIQTHDSQ